MKDLDLDAIERTAHMSLGKSVQAEVVLALVAEVHRLRGFLCQVHDDCKAHPAMAMACSVESAPREGDLAVWIHGQRRSERISPILEIQGSKVWADWNPVWGKTHVNIRHVRVVRRATEEEIQKRYR